MTINDLAALVDGSTAFWGHVETLGHCPVCNASGLSVYSSGRLPAHHGRRSGVHCPHRFPDYTWTRVIINGPEQPVSTGADPKTS